MCTMVSRTVAKPPAAHQVEMQALGTWVELKEEKCSRGRRIQHLLVNRRERVALTLTSAEAGFLRTRADDSPPPFVDQEFMAELRKQGFVSDSEPSRPAQRRRFAHLRTFAATLDVRTERGNRILGCIYRRGARRAFTKIGFAIQTTLALLGLLAVAHDLSSSATMHLRLHSSQIPFAIALSLIAVAVHEAAHALVVIHNGRRIDAIGFRLHLGTPAFYVESIDALLLPRRQRIIQAVAGSWAEWGVTSLVALWVWIAPSHIALAMLYRFVVLNCITIWSNLLPFVGLDGHLVFADLIGEPDLQQQVRGALTRVINGKLAGHPTARRDWLLAVYSALNAAVATVLLLLSGLFWYALFGDAITIVIHQGATGRTALAAIAFILLRPAAIAAAPRVRSAAATAHELAARLRFRLQWRWRIPAALAIAGLDRTDGRERDERALGIIAGSLVRRRVWRRGTPPHLGPVAYIHRGTVTTVNPLTGIRRQESRRATASGHIASCRRGTVLMTTA